MAHIYETSLDDAEKTVREFNDYNGHFVTDTLLVQRLRNNGFDTIDIAVIIQVLQSTCKHCWDSDNIGCTCMADE